MQSSMLAAGMDALAALWPRAVAWYTLAGEEQGGLVIYGIFLRALALCIAFALATLGIQLRGLAASSSSLKRGVAWSAVHKEHVGEAEPDFLSADGLDPAYARMLTFQRHYGVRAALYWPSLLWPAVWLRVSTRAFDALLSFMIWSATAAALAASLGGVATQPLLAYTWAAMLSIDTSAHPLVYPWDSFALELLFQVVWWPSASTLWPQLAAGSAWSWRSLALDRLPSPLQCFMVRLLVVRLLVGFGKLKFMGTTPRDKLYIKSFLITQPIATPAAYIMNRLLPNAAFIFSVGTCTARQRARAWSPSARTPGSCRARVV
ncbi:hypothetical protein EON68_00440 [archaeon]|nr:MAG: hypothetical protein EON68_00440 [archaeon]